MTDDTLGGAMRCAADPDGVHGTGPSCMAQAGPVRDSGTAGPGGPRDAAAGGPPVLDVRGLRVDYGPRTALVGVDLHIGAPSLCAVLGMNGSGKSTFFKALMGMVRPVAGDIEILGLPSLAARRRGWVGYVPQSEQIDLDFPLDVRDVVMMGRYGFMGLTRRPRRADRDAVGAALAAVGLEALASRPIGELSGGQRKRVFVARAIAQGARLLLLDEPFAGVDKDSEAAIATLLRDLHARGVTVLVSTHDLASVPQLCDEAVLVNRRVHYHGPVAGALEPGMLRRAFSTPHDEEER